MTSTASSMALSSFSINYIDSSKFMSSFDPMSAISGSILQPTLTLADPTYDQPSETMTVGSLSLSEAGTVYFVLVFHKRIVKN